MTTLKKIIFTASTALILAGTTSSAQAIECQDGYQVLRNSEEIVSPYCQDNLLGYIARSKYGYRYSNRQIRNNPNIKLEICKTAGKEPRLSDICVAVAPNL